MPHTHSHVEQPDRILVTSRILQTKSLPEQNRYPGSTYKRLDTSIDISSVAAGERPSDF